jgi:hypothetical protein
VIERALVEYFRCPEDNVRMSVAGALSADAGYFRFGPEICYGRTTAGERASHARGALYDARPAPVAEGDPLRLVFDPTEVVDNLRLERYAADAGHIEVLRHKVWQRPYYLLRNFMPDGLRRTLQRAYLRDWRTHAFPRWPVDHTVDRLLDRLLLHCLRSRGLTRLPFVWFWPGGAPSCAIVTHDVETEVGRDRCEWLMDVDDGYGVKTSFELVPEERYALTAAFLDRIRSRGFEINVHDLNHDGRLFGSRDEFQRRAQAINRYVGEFGARGFRSGALYRRPEWFEALDVAYDMSIPNAGHLESQRGGCCTVMPYFIGDIVELPLTTTQDYSLFHILQDYSNDVWKNQMESIMGRHGLMSFIVHPDYLGSERERRVYRTLLDHLVTLREGGRCWVARPGEVERWWRQRSRMTVVPSGAGWRIEGEGSERARLAYAVVEGDALTFALESGPASGEGSRRS